MDLCVGYMGTPVVYLYDFRDDRHCLYLGECSTCEGLGLLPHDCRIRIQHMYTDNVLETSNWPSRPQSVDSIIEFVESTDSIFDFECDSKAGIALATHDDSECHFKFDDQDNCENLLRRAVPTAMADILWAALLANPGKYVSINEQLVVKKYQTFDDYLAAADR